MHVYSESRARKDTRDSVQHKLEEEAQVVADQNRQKTQDRLVRYTHIHVRFFDVWRCGWDYMQFRTDRNACDKAHA